MFTRSLLILGCMAFTASAENLVVNGDFENGTNGYSSDYTPYAGGTITEGSYATVQSPHDDHPAGANFPDHTSGHGLMLIANGSTDRPRVLWRQTISVKPSREYAFSGWITSWGMGGVGRSENPAVGFDPCPSIIAVSINGIDCGKVIQVTATNGLWEKFVVTWNSQGASSARVEIRLLTTAAIGNDVAIDDLGFYSAGTVQTPQQRLLSTLNSDTPDTSGISPTANSPLTAATGGFTTTNLVGGVQIRHAVEITWPSIANQIYQVQTASSLESEAWTDLGNPVSGTGTTNAVFDEAIQPSRFYRVVAFE